MSKRPNILLIMSDQHHSRVMGCRGDRVISTPNLDQLASQGVVFENAYCNYPLCCPSRMSFMTGREPYEIQGWTNGFMLPSSIPTFAHALGQAGYDTLLNGRMHFNGPDQRHGFMERTFPEIGGNSEGALKGANQFGRLGIEKSGPGKNHYLLYDEQCTGKACDWLSERGNHPGSNPFCMVLGLLGPHAPFVCPPDLFYKYYKKVDLPPIPAGHLENLHPFHKRYQKNSRITDLSETEIRRTRAAYYGMVEFLDIQVGRVMDQLRKSSLLDDTIVIYTSDHGEAAGEHGMWWKFTFFEGSISVPLIISHPGRYRSGTRQSVPVALTDLAPTLVAMGGAPTLPGIKGRDLTPLLQGEASDGWKEREVFSELIGDASRLKEGPKGGPSRMIRKGDWKCNYYHGESPELYDLKNDPGEFQNRAGDPSCAGILKDLTGRILKDWNPEQVSIQLQQQLERHTFVRQSPAPEGWLKGEAWQGPPDYGQVDPVDESRVR